MTLGINMNVYGWIKDAVFLKSYINVCVCESVSLSVCVLMCVCVLSAGGEGGGRIQNLKMQLPGYSQTFSWPWF